jgi:hypothetical protein
MTPEEITVIQARCDAATPGPWEIAGQFVIGGDNEYIQSGAIDEYGEPEGEYAVSLIGMVGPGHDADREFIAYARTDVPALLTALAAERIRSLRAVYLIAHHPEWCYPNGEPRETIPPGVDRIADILLGIDDETEAIIAARRDIPNTEVPDAPL